MIFQRHSRDGAHGSNTLYASAPPRNKFHRRGFHSRRVWSQFWRPEVPDRDVSRVWEHLCGALLLASGGPRRSLTCGWLSSHHLPSVCVYLCVLMSPVYKDTGHVG